jgi:hypothetical protein
MKNLESVYPCRECAEGLKETSKKNSFKKDKRISLTINKIHNSNLFFNLKGINKKLGKAKFDHKEIDIFNKK